MNYKKLELEIDKEIKKHTSRKVWIQKCNLEAENEQLKYELNQLYKRNEILEKRNNENFSKCIFNPDINLFEIEKEYIKSALKFFNNDKIKTAEALQISIKSLYIKIHDYKIEEI